MSKELVAPAVAEFPPSTMPLSPERKKRSLAGLIRSIHFGRYTSSGTEDQFWKRVFEEFGFDELRGQALRVAAVRIVDGIAPKVFDDEQDGVLRIFTPKDRLIRIAYAMYVLSDLPNDL
jgi:hypothetical protein